MSFWHAKRVMVTGGNGFLGTLRLRSGQAPSTDTFASLSAWFTLSPSTLLRVNSAEVFRTWLRACLRRLDDTHSGRALSDAKPQTLA